MESLHEFDQQFLDNLSKRAIYDNDIQLLLMVISELNAALSEKRELNPDYLTMLKLLLAAHGTIEVDKIRFVASTKSKE